MPGYQAGQQSYKAQPPYKGSPGTGGARWFFENILGFVVVGIILLFVLIMGVQSGLPFFSLRNIQNIIRPIIDLTPLVVGFVLTMRAFGADFSLLGVASLSGVVYAVTGSLLVTLLCSLLAGAVVAGFVVGLRLPATLVGLVMMQIVSAIALLVGDVPSLFVENPVPPFLIVLLAIMAVGTGFFGILLTRLGHPLKKRPKQQPRTAEAFLAYPIASLLAGISGLPIAPWRSVALPAFGNNYWPLLLMVWAIASCSKLLDNRFFPVAAGMAALVVYNIASNAMFLLSMSMNLGFLLHGFFILLLMGAAALARRPFETADKEKPKDACAGLRRPGSENVFGQNQQKGY